MSGTRKVKLTLVDGRGLNNKWFSLTTLGLFAQVTVDKGLPSAQRHRSPLVDRSRNPVFKHSWIITINDESTAVLELIVKSMTKGDRVMAVCDIPITTYERLVTCNLRPPEQASHHVTGTVTLKLAAESSTRAVPLQPGRARRPRLGTNNTPVSRSGSTAQCPPISPTPASGSASTTGQRMLPTTPGLPYGWERKIDRDERAYYVDHNTKTTQWDPPQTRPATQFSHLPSNSVSSSAGVNAADSLGPLPAGWETRTDPQGNRFYIDHNTRTTTWHRPTSQHLAAVQSFHDRDVVQSHRQFNQRSILGMEDTAQTQTQANRNIANNEQNVNALAEQLALTLQLEDNIQERQQAGGTLATQSAAPARPQPPSQPVTCSTEATSSQNGNAHTAVTTGMSATLPLPPGWEMRVSGTGQPYFVDHMNRRTQWVDPRSQMAQMPLPRGWAQGVTNEGRVYFIDHNTRTTTFEDPRTNKVYQKEYETQIPEYQRNFKQKLGIFRLNMVLMKPGECSLQVSRENLFEDSFNEVMRQNILAFKHRLNVSFIGEKGLDYGGLQKEWFFLLSNEMVNPNYCLFKYANEDHTTIAINPESGINPEHLDYFRFIGRVIGLAIFHGRFIDIGFTLPLYKQMINKPLTMNDLEQEDPEYHKNLLWILNNEIDELGLGMMFSCDYERFGEMQSYDLKPGGSEIEVTDANKEEYVRLVVKWRLTRGITDQWESLKSGINDVVGLEQLRLFDEKELEVLICGVNEVDVKDWEDNSVYKNYSPDSTQVKWLWEILLEWDNEKRVRFLQFVTGTCRVPMGGFRDLQGSTGIQLFCVERIGTNEWLPRSHTCFNRLDLPPYESKEQMEQKLTLAIEETEGFANE
eukprot:CFRG3682T1